MHFFHPSAALDKSVSRKHFFSSSPSLYDRNSRLFAPLPERGLFRVVRAPLTGPLEAGIPPAPVTARCGSAQLLPAKGKPGRNQNHKNPVYSIAKDESTVYINKIIETWTKMENFPL